jgi:16S rRNA (guanine966-N2)-methyltransferase
MSIVQPRLPDARVLDLFAGSGALGLEALSRGARSAHFVEVSAPSLRALRANIEALGAGPAAVVHRGDALRFARALPEAAYDVAFADPPYRLGLATGVAERWLEVPFAALLGVEHETSEKLPGPGDTRRYGTTAITFYRRDGGPRTRDAMDDS